MRQPARPGGDVHAPDLDAVHHLVEALARCPAENRVGTDAEPVHHQFGGVHALVAHLVDLPGDREPGKDLTEPGRLLDQERRHLAVNAGIRVDLTGSQHQHRDQRGRATIGQPHLRAVQHEIVTDPRGLRGDRRDIRPAPRLGHRERTAHLTGRHPRQVVRLLLLSAVLHEHVGHDEVRVDHPGHAHPPAGDLLDHQGVRQQRLPQTPELLGDHQAEHAELLQAIDDRLRVLISMLKTRRDRDDLRLHEIVHRRQDVALILGQTLGPRQPRHQPTPSLKANGPSVAWGK